MRPVFYDLHIHSCLSPCGDQDMTPNNIVNMALLKELELIALTDHNSCKNCPAIMKAAAGTGLVVLPGMELTTAEEAHVVCLFPALDNAMAFDAFVHERLAPVKNAPDIFGEQLILDKNDDPIGHEDLLLVNATSISIDEAPAAVAQFCGLCFPAHIDRPSNSVLSNLGVIPPECGFHILEVAHPERFFAGGAHSDLQEGYTVVTNSDAHDLGNISERIRCIHLETIDYAGLAARLL